MPLWCVTTTCGGGMSADARSAFGSSFDLSCASAGVASSAAAASRNALVMVPPGFAGGPRKKVGGKQARDQRCWEFVDERLDDGHEHHPSRPAVEAAGA